MLHWFSKRLNDLREVKREERGFTLIELLVVVIIIGILAAIAIPTFLNQRERAQISAVQSDLRNAAAAANACSADGDGDYTGCSLSKLKNTYDFNQTDNVKLENVKATPTEWAATAYWDGKKAATAHKFSTNTGRVEEAK